ncbi:MAG: hypothetical protein PUA84_05815 [Oscillospiraceae bacterium]|nr:hypothetical protein [Oscillospiraceae bacterium]
MDDLFGRMQSVLSDPESMQQLQELASLLGNDDDSDEEQAAHQEKSSGDSGFDIGKIMQLSSLMNSTKNDEDAALLLALKPHLKEERQKKVDKAVKLLKLIDVWKTLKDTGMLKDFI